MCGLLLWIKFLNFSPRWIGNSLSKPAVQLTGTWFEECVAALARRGPDYQGAENIIVTTGGGERFELHFRSSVLHLRGTSIAKQPVRTSSGGLLQFVGEVFGKTGPRPEDSDTDWLASKVDYILRLWDTSNVSWVSIATHFRDLIEMLTGPFAIVLWVPERRLLLCSRDKLGRRSLVYGNTPDGSLIVSSVTSLPAAAWEEVPVTGVMCFDFGGAEPALHHLHWQTRAPFEQEWWWTPQSTRAPLATGPKESDLSRLVKEFDGVLFASVTRRVTNVEGGIFGQSPVAILFSGGLDCTVLAALVAEAMPSDQPVELINVAFDPIEAPDRLTALGSFAELVKIFGPRRFRLILVDVPDDELWEHEAEIYEMLGPKGSNFDFDMAAALWFAARGRGYLCSTTFHEADWWLQVVGDNQQMQHVQLDEGNVNRTQRKNINLNVEGYRATEAELKELWGIEVEPEGLPSYMASARVLLSGQGADELFGGYGRHTVALNVHGIDGMRHEMVEDLKQMWTRNLGRDDRVIADHGREVRQPFLDEDLLTFVGRLPMECIAFGPCGGTVPARQKWLLREVASSRGLSSAASYKKRAIMFGSRITKKTNSRHSTSNRKTKGTTAYQVLHISGPQAAEFLAGTKPFKIELHVHHVQHFLISLAASALFTFIASSKICSLQKVASGLHRPLVKGR